MPALKVVVLLAAGVAGALAGVGCVLATLFELQGLGRPPGSELRPWYVALLGLGLLASVAIPLGLWRVLLPAASPGWAWLAAAAALVVVLALLGVVAIS